MLGPFYLNMIMLVAMLGPYVLLVVYCIAFKSGGFNGTVAGRKYIESCQSVQNSKVFRTYCNVLGLVCAGGVAYGLFEAQIGTADVEEKEPDQQATQNLIVSGLVSGLPGDGPRLPAVSRSVRGPRWNCMDLYVWPVVAVDLFYNRYGCADSVLQNSSLGDHGADPCSTPLRFCGQRLRCEDTRGAPQRVAHQTHQAAPLGQYAV